MAYNGKKIAMGAVIAVILAAGLAVGSMYLAPSGSSNPTTTAGGATSNNGSLSSSSSFPSSGGTSTSGNSQVSSQSTSGSGILGPSGALNIYLTDAPPSSPQFKYLLVNVSSVVLSYEGNVSSLAPRDQWVYNVSSKTGMNVNLTSLVNSKVLLGATKAPAGNITGITFDISGARAFFTDGTSAQLKIVANGRLMIPINCTMKADGTTDLTVDITPNSIHISQGKVPVLTPVVHVTAVQSGDDSTTTANALVNLTSVTSTSVSGSSSSMTTTSTSATSSSATTSSSSTSTTTSTIDTSTTSTTTSTTSTSTSTAT